MTVFTISWGTTALHYSRNSFLLWQLFGIVFVALTIPVSALDACNGIFSPVPGYANGVYHYVLENVKGARSSIGCYHGVVSSAYTQALQGVLDGGNTPPPPASTTTPATAQSLAASKSEDALLRTLLRVSGLEKYC